MWSIWRAFWGDLNTPSTYYADPYGAAVNQISHMALGAVAVVAICAAWALIYGEMPYRWGAGVAVVVLYAAVIELGVQRWSGQDSTVDTAFVAMGAAAPLVSLHEVTFLPAIRLEFYAGNALTWLVCAVATLAVYVAPRIRRWAR